MFRYPAAVLADALLFARMPQHVGSDLPFMERRMPIRRKSGQLKRLGRTGVIEQQSQLGE